MMKSLFLLFLLIDCDEEIGFFIIVLIVTAPCFWLFVITPDQTCLFSFRRSGVIPVHFYFCIKIIIIIIHHKGHLWVCVFFYFFFIMTCLLVIFAFCIFMNKLSQFVCNVFVQQWLFKQKVSLSTLKRKH